MSKENRNSGQQALGEHLAVLQRLYNDTLNEKVATNQALSVAYQGASKCRRYKMAHQNELNSVLAAARARRQLNLALKRAEECVRDMLYITGHERTLVWALGDAGARSNSAALISWTRRELASARAQGRQFTTDEYLHRLVETLKRGTGPESVGELDHVFN